jgi:hypothetical protein
MFQDLDDTLENVLTGAAFPAPLGPVDISFKKPDKTVSFNGATIDLFLYSVKENRALRDPVPILEFENGAYKRRLPPMRVDCDYIVTAWNTTLSLDARVAAEHQLLAAALTRLSRFPVIPTGFLAGDMVNQPFPVQLWVAQEEEGKSLGEFWSSLGIAPVASFHLMATITLEPADPVIDGLPVTTSVIELGSDLDRDTPPDTVIYSFGGTIIDAAQDPVPKAVVTLDGVRETETDDQGRYRFGGVAPGTHAIRIAKDAASTTGSVTIPPDPNAVPPPTLTDFNFTL